MAARAVIALAALSITALVGASAVAATVLPGTAASAPAQADRSSAVAGMPIGDGVPLGERQSGTTRFSAMPDSHAPAAARPSNTIALVHAPHSAIGAWLYPAVAAVVIPLLTVVLLLLFALRRRRLGRFGDPKLSVPSGMEPFFFA